MPSLYHHDILSHDYANHDEFPDSRLLSIGHELTQMLNETEVPRQRDQINMLLGRLAFEVGCRTWDGYGESE